MVYPDLVTTAEVQSALPTLTTAQLADLPTVIAAITARIARSYPKARPVVAYDEVIDAGLARVLTLCNRPIVQVQRLCSDLTGVITIKSTDAAARSAGVTVTMSGDDESAVTTGITLDATTRGVAAAPQTILWSAAPCVDDLATAINALAGWSATVTTGCGDIATADIRAREGRASVKPNGAVLYAFERELDNFEVKPRAGEIFLYEWRLESYRWPDRTWGTDPRMSLYRVQYTAGIPTTTDIKRGAIMWAKDVFDRTPRPGGIVSENSVGAYSVVVGTMGVPGVVADCLSPYRDRSIS